MGKAIGQGLDPVMQAVETGISRQVVYGITSGLFVYGWLSVNIYLPILPQLEAALGTTATAARLTVTIFLVGFACTQLIWGPLSDRFGRKPVLLTGLAISVTGAIVAGLSTNTYVFAAARLLEAIGLGVGPVLARSVLTDALDRAHVAIAMSYVATVVAIVPAVAPIVGGYIDLLLSWRGIFFFLALYGSTILVLCTLRLPETNRSLQTDLSAARVIAELREILSEPRYVGYVSVYGIAFGSLVGYYAAAPFIFVRDLDYSAHAYGYLLIFNVTCYVLGVSASRLAVPKVGTDLPILYAMIAYALAIAAFAALDLFTTMSTLSVLIPMSVFIFGTGLVSPAANTGAMTLFRDKAGAATSLVGFSIALGGAIFSGALATVHITRLVELGAYVGVSAMLTFAVYMLLIRRRHAPDTGQ